MNKPSNLDDFQEYSKAVINEYPQMDEENTKSKLIQPFLQILGWSIAFDARMEHKLQVGSTRKSVDYALEIEDSPIMFVEAKGLYQDIKDEYVDQIESYMRVADIKWGVLTNGRLYRVFRMQHLGNKSEITEVNNLDVTEVSDNKNEARIVSKEYIESGESKSIADRKTKISNARDSLQENKDDISENITRMIEDNTNQVVTNYAESMSREFVDDLIDRLERESLDIESEPTDNEADQERNKLETSEDYLSSLMNEIGFTINDQNKLTSNGNSKYKSDLLAESIEKMLDDGIITDADIPIKIPGSEHYFLNYSPHKDESQTEDMRSSKEIRGGEYYIEVNNSSKRKAKIITELVDLYC